MSKQNKTEKREQRHRRVRAKVCGTATRPRLSVFKSNKKISVQLIDDNEGKTLAAASSTETAGRQMMERANAVGKLIAERAKAKKIEKVVFDRGGYLYAGKVKAVADGAREAGLLF